MRIIIICFLIALINSACSAGNSINGTNYLIQPTGIYGVGYKDMFMINTNICPDQFYIKGVNNNDFSSNNIQYCHEINLRIYYPSNDSLNLSDKYYSPVISTQIEFYAKKFNLSKSDISLLNTLFHIKTYSREYAIPKIKKFPLIVFLPGSGMGVQAYNNIIGQLVSNGYIVLGMNSMFINGALMLSNGHVVKVPEKYQDFGRLENLDDLKFVLQRLQHLNYGNDIKSQIDFKRIGILGHSMGGMNIVNLLKTDKTIHTNALILLDPGNVVESANYPIQSFNISSMIIWSSKFKHLLHGSSNLGAKGFEVILAPSLQNLDYSNHENFSDFSTLQYHPAYNISKIKQFLTDTKHLGVGLGNGFNISNAINRYILAFYNLSLKNQDSSFLNSCKAFDDYSLLNCGH